jgi:hypothetical protein
MVVAMPAEKRKNRTATRVVWVGVAMGVVVLSGGGGAVAARLIGSAQIADNAIRSVDVRDDGLRPRDLRPGLRETWRSALTGYEVQHRRFIVAEDLTEFSINCPEGKVVLGAGEWTGGAAVVHKSAPAVTDDSTNPPPPRGWEWTIKLRNPEVVDEVDARLYITCADHVR